MTEEVILKVGLTPRHPCSYLGHEQEQLLVLMDHELLNAAGYERLLTAGFRRSGNDIYRPHCPACSACQSLRIHSERFVPNRSQKRVRQLNRDLELVLSYDDKPEYYQLYERYIRERHHDGSMYPPSRTQYKGFLHCDWMPPLYMEIRKEGRLIGVATTDLLPHSMSAMYTFFDPDYADRSLGTFAILSQLELARRTGRSWLYLGYLVEACRKMNYKRQYLPHELLVQGEWKNIDTKPE
ncbi:arginyl-tRNA-protein transferase [compost metagenome]|jgi:arginine-tRNA-protein transferase|uniref:Aspartate/glutamate leucyltransferase n=1 Tax=Aeromonas media TaxID=651 RepID=A0AAP6L0U7_AERME|nr:MULTISPECIES: arginyltransferase [Aeromonas]MBL0511562.1 arginyltransferase [Aeromonas media]MCE9923342.1 arginyltransferase [Aeromonas media]MDM5058048.1 arginyltransferase [Aeromonas rivipollensis]MDM5122737.1 arginyltransferase [Aeromonas rivipollensis]MDX7900455.1 arginyltransferase [Aeromonas media]